MSSELFQRVEMAPRDPILGVTEAFNADANPNKVNLGVGVYYDDKGKLPLLNCVRTAEAEILGAAAARGYQPIEGLGAYNKAVQALVFGAGSAVLTAERAVTVETLGGTGALKVGADFLKRIQPNATVFISDPSWENHRALFEAAGFPVQTYTYYDAATRGLNFAGMRDALRAMPAGSIVVLHACCHNPTGADLTPEQWQEVAAIAAECGLVPFLDMAYQGFGDGIDADGYAVRLFADSGRPCFVSTSFSKSFSLYGERVGALTIVATDREEAARVLSQVKRVIRTNYSNPPTHGGKIVATVLSRPELRTQWENELGEMRERIKEMRKALVSGLAAARPDHDFSFVLRQKGMFSYSGLSAAQVERLRAEHGIYAVSSGRICVAALNSGNISHVVDAVAKVL